MRRFDVKEPADLERPFVSTARERVGGLIVPREGIFVAHRRRLIELAVKSRLPVLYTGREFIEAGGLMSFAADENDLMRRVVARYVDRILKGAKPSDLPFEQPTKFELVINLKTAKALGLRLPESLLRRADQVLE
jgi:putative tryptophan/tyrosine transport system substrate-binding protein